MQIAVETERASDMPRLLSQLAILNANDSSIRVFEMVEMGVHHDAENGGAHHQPIINIREACALLPALEEGGELRLPPSASIQSRFWMKVGFG